MGTEKLGQTQNARIDGARIKAIREEKGLTQLYLAHYVGVTTDTISRWENRKYPSVKRENAQRLAEALEVDLQEILERDDAGEKREEPVSEQGDQAPAPRKVFPSMGGKGLIIAIFLVIAATLGLVLYKAVLPGSRSARYVAMRTLPPHVAPGDIFPVVLSIMTDSPENAPVIIREVVPRAGKLVGYSPQAVAQEGADGRIQWIFPVKKDGLKVVYVLELSKTVKMGKRLRFKGELAARSSGRNPIPITGDSRTEVAPFHWSDKDQNGEIDDQEILDAFDEFGNIEAMRKALTEMETLWAKGGYQWDPGEKVFVPAQKKEE